MKINIKTFFCFLVSFVFLNGYAQKTNADMAGFGTSSCKEYLSDKSAQLAYIAWAQGFISALDMVKKHSFNVGINFDFLSSWLDDFCSKNPEKIFLEGIDSFVSKYVSFEPTVEVKPAVLPLNLDENYKTIEIGMSEAQVQKKLGNPNSRMAVSTERGVFDCWRWFFSNGSRDHALIFLNKKVVQLGITSCPFWLENTR